MDQHFLSNIILRLYCYKCIFKYSERIFLFNSFFRFLQGQTTLINTLRRYSSMQELNRNYDEPDAGQGTNPRVTWHGGPPVNQQMDSEQYDFEEDYRVLEQQYHDEARLYNTLPGGAQFQKYV